MAGAENIVNEILREAREKADGTLSEAKRKADMTVSAARADGVAEMSATAEKAEKAASDYAKRVESQVGLRRRQALLSARQDIIETVIEKAYQTLSSQNDEAYFAMIGKLVGQYAQPEKGEILFSARDLGRLPDGCAAVIERAAAGRGGSLTISETPAEIENGFILRYGGIEENCTLEALFDDRLDELRDRVREVLW
ncbi:MAG: V-type ATP synthase subunit E [Eubacteriales bacterium]|jgi:V/A-type H+-transporting ATPase subunit E